ncbi:hypothetical protein EV641_104239 [Rhodococcus sp. SMB37]|uniref:hypothetical protein n=1 Tax=Rhodococcus sp. SMB37 TaxID=2512213 RepID=UPI000ACF7448|nr:hypothetical protein [Rhodococcus sp. SMB37]TCN54974.1 hypothetical protein EV641_104239 [Rhodococcus sp. SMB37]
MADWVSMGARGRLRRAWDEFVGPEAGPVENTVTAGLSVLGAVAAPRLSRRSRDLSTVESLTLRAVAVDLWGGAWVNNTRACTRWYERPAASDVDHLKFAVLHVHPFLFALWDRDEPHRMPVWLWAGAHYGYMMAATVAIRTAPRYRRPLGAALTVGGIALDRVLGPSRIAPWFGPVYYTKLLLGHAGASLWPDRALYEPPVRVAVE